MTTLHSLLANSVVSAAALAGTLAAIAVVRIRPDRDGLSSRLVFALTLVSLVLAMRLLAWNVHHGIFETLTRLFAAWIPLAALLVLEGLQRRHAPALMKQASLIGGVLFSVLAFVSGNLGLPLYALLAFQLGSFAAIYVLAITGSDDGLTEQEKRVIARIRFALPVLAVFLASDYGVFEQVVPVRASGVAILFFCWMAISSTNGTTGRRDAAFAFVITALLGAIIGLSATAMAQMDWAFAVQLSAMTLCTGILALVLNETVNAFAVTRRNDIMLALTTADTSSVRAFITSVAAASPLDGSTILDESELAQFDVPTLRAAFARQPVLRPRDIAMLPEDARQQFDSLLITHDATHLLMLAAHPLLVMATTLPSVGRSSAIETELALVQRMASLISRREDSDGTA
ncbi:MAG: hypothetical protein P0Y65_10075 [Candidatus Devosia phytovorans]|uniref:Uncharacterized protein n=1 Tax=Candidatus Devosia phytovorans TaxID=3121372 RepID=A0AAJ5VYL0_9HYPH|nr:hypothetical protein [Devosia sp.]WEK06565.1 MAG: hypothetical protein P0Y65_10075 [Devosia sp.]